MSCNTSLPLATIVQEINEYLDNNYVDKDDPRITQGVFTEPTIRGGLVLDDAAKADFCEIVQECGLQAPIGKEWIKRPLYPNFHLTSYEEGGEVFSSWTPLPTRTGDRPTGGMAVGDVFIDKSLGANGKPIWWNGEAWIDALGEVV